MTTTTTSITPRQREILSWIAAYIAKRGFSPNIREIQTAFRLKSPNGVMCHLHPLRRKQLVSWVENSPRTLRLTPEGEEVLRAS